MYDAVDRADLGLLDEGGGVRGLGEDEKGGLWGEEGRLDRMEEQGAF